MTLSNFSIIIQVNKVSTNIVVAGLILSVTIFLNILTTSKLIIPLANGKRTKPYMPKAKILNQILLLSSCNLFKNMASSMFHNQP